MNLHYFETLCKGRGDKINFVPLGDIHLGTKNCDEEKLLETIDWIKKTPNTYWLGMGDVAEFINYTDDRFDPKNLHSRFERCLDNLHYEQINYIGKLLSPIKDKCMGLLEGNHEDKLRLKYHASVIDILAYKLETVNLGYTCLIKWIFKRKTGDHGAGREVVIYATHGYGGGGRGSKINKVIAIAKDFEADIFLFGHVHEKTGVSREKLCIIGRKDSLKLVSQKKIFAITGTFYKTYEVGSKSYGEKVGYPPTPTGVIKITIEPFRNQKINGRAVDLPPHIHISE